MGGGIHLQVDQVVPVGEGREAFAVHEPGEQQGPGPCEQRGHGWPPAFRQHWYVAGAEVPTTCFHPETTNPPSSFMLPQKADTHEQHSILKSASMGSAAVDDHA